jgi:hypothetical protein
MNQETSVPFNNIHTDFLLAKKLLFDVCDVEITELTPEDESKEYGACMFKLNGIFVKFRVAKTTPTKTGQFVTIWKRNAAGITEPFHISDNIDIVMISSRGNEKYGVFIFPKSALVSQGVMSTNTKEGKRGIRVYPPWDKATNKQAEKTQKWQTDYFLDLTNNNPIDILLAKNFFTKV